jgi:hypothetical protein
VFRQVADLVHDVGTFENSIGLFSVNFYRAPVLLHHVGSFLALKMRENGFKIEYFGVLCHLTNHDDRSIGIAAYDVWHYAGIDDSQP